MATSSQIRLSAGAPALARVQDNPTGSIDAANRWLQKNHDEHHIFWRDVAGHNHVVHSVLTTFALGGGPNELQRAFDDGADIQQPIPPVDRELVERLHDEKQFRMHMGRLDEYANFLAFFERQITNKGYEAVVDEFCFGGTDNAETLFANLFEGLYHPMIHLAFGIEFQQPTIVAEALAQMASHDSMGIEAFLTRSERAAAAAGAADISPSSATSTPLLDLYQEAHDNEVLRNAPKLFEGGPSRVRDGVLGQAGHIIEALAARFRVSPATAESLDMRTAEVFNCSAYLAGAAQRAGKARKLDFFHLHTVTASLSLAVLLRQDWISDRIKARLIEWKARVDLVWYAASGAVELDIEHMRTYRAGPSADMTDWGALYRATTLVHDDGHLAKFVRALKLGQELSRPYEDDNLTSGRFPTKKDLWMTVARMGYDSTYNEPIERKWIWGVGFDGNWDHVASLEP